VVPGTGADEQAADEVARPVIPIGCTGIGVIRIVAPIANRGAVPIVARIIVGSGNFGTNADSDANSHLCAGRYRER
jgi:hypothetical protein